MFQSQFGFLSTLWPDLHDFAGPVTNLQYQAHLTNLDPPGKSDLTEGVEQHVPTGARLGVDVTLVEDVTVV